MTLSSLLVKPNCSSEFCNNKGLCKFRYNKQVRYCECEEAFSGKNCEFSK